MTPAPGRPDTPRGVGVGVGVCCLTFLEVFLEASHNEPDYYREMASYDRNSIEGKSSLAVCRRGGWSSC